MCMGSSASAFSCHMQCSQSHWAGKIQFSCSSRSRQIHWEPQQSCPEFTPKLSKSLLNWRCSEGNTVFFVKKTYSSHNFSIFSNFPVWYCLFTQIARVGSNSLSLRNTCCISCSFLFSSTSSMRFSLKKCFKTVKTHNRSWGHLSDLFHCVSSNKVG